MLMLTAGEALEPSVEKFLKDVFRADIHQLYAMREFGTLAFECRNSHSLHVASDWFVFEIVGPDGTPLSDGTQGELIVSDLSNRHVPLLRYATGDAAVLQSDAECCELALPAIVQLVGRSPPCL